LSENRSKLQLVKNTAPQNLGAVISTRESTPIPSKLDAQKENLSSATSSLTILNLYQLTEGEQFRVNELAKGVIPEGIIKGVIRGARSWDLRPLIGEGKSTLVLRLYGPEVMLSASHSARTLEQLQLIASLPESNSGLIEFGTLDSQIFTLRPLYLNSLAERLNSGERFSFRSALGIALEIVRILKSWQNLKIVHGHLSPSNICFSSEGEILLVDPGVLIAQYLAGRELNSEIKIADDKYVSPELVKLGLIDVRADNYSLGTVLMELFRKVRRARDEQGYDPELERMNLADVEAITELTSGLCDLNIDARAPLEFVERLLDSRIQRVQPVVPLALPLAVPPAPVEPERPSQLPEWEMTIPESFEAEDLLPSPVLVEKAFEGGDFESAISPEDANGWQLGNESTELKQQLMIEKEVREEMLGQTNLISKIIKGALVALTLVCLFLAYRTFFGASELEFANLT